MAGPSRKSRRPRDPKWAALRQWHREQREHNRRLANDTDYQSVQDHFHGRADAHHEALTEMSQLSRQHGRKETRG